MSNYQLHTVSQEVFAESMLKAFELNPNIAKACTYPDEDSLKGKTCYLLDGKTNLGGFCISDGSVNLHGELTHVFATKRGVGDILLKHAIRLGANNLDCFDGYLTEFYSKHGFKVVKTEPNWDGPEFPSVVYMARF